MKGEKVRKVHDKYSTVCIPKSKTIYRKFREAYLKTFDKEYVVCYICSIGPLVFFDGTAPKELWATLDHIVPPNKGGSYYSFDNFAIACFACNNKKGDKLLEKVRA